jgi:putative transposase
VLKKQGQYLTLFQQKLLLKALQGESRLQYRQRIEIMLLADKGYSATQICKQLKCAQETARYWLEMARSGLIHQWNQHHIGRPKRVNEEYLDRLYELATHSPREYGYCFDRWTAGCLSRHLAKEFAVEVSERHISRLLKKMGLSTRQQQVSKRRGITIRDLPPDRSNEPYYFLNLMSV